MTAPAETHPKVWKAGTADEVWKVIVCARDAYETERLLWSLVYILTDAGNNLELGLAKVSAMSGDDIVSALRAHVESSRKPNNAQVRARLGVRATGPSDPAVDVWPRRDEGDVSLVAGGAAASTHESGRREGSACPLRGSGT